MAEQISCRPSYLSQIFNGNSQLALEQGQRLNTFLHHGPTESEYFLTMLQYERAGTTELKNYFRDKLEQLSKKHNTLSSKINHKKKLVEKINQDYFRFWYYGAIHALVSIPEYNDTKKIAEKLNLAVELVQNVLNELTKLEFLKHHNGIYQIQEGQVHLTKSADFIKDHHINWRLKAIEKLSSQFNDDDLFYSSITSLSHEDFLKLKELLSVTIKNSKKIIQESKEEKLVSFNIDFFEL